MPAAVWRREKEIGGLAGKLSLHVENEEHVTAAASSAEGATAFPHFIHSAVMSPRFWMHCVN